jgi:Asp-tRNA(Asn)/Glu-tRNA(Gln) amidotransferase B subunit
MSPEFMSKWERLLEGVDKQKIPVEFIKKLVLKLERKRQRTINIERLLKDGLDPDQVEDAVSKVLTDLDDEVTGIEFILNVQCIAETVQPETDQLLKGL